MPEGHTLRRLADELKATFGGRRLRVTSPQGRFVEEAALLDGTRLRGADAAGKHLFLAFEAERVVHVHLGLIGSFQIHRSEPADPVGQVRLRLVASEPAAYADLRGATRCALVTAAEQAEVTSRLGPDPLRPDADPDLAWRRVSLSDRPIGDLLMDQSVLAGVGNVFRAEVLFRQGMHPLRPGRTLRRRQFEALWRDLVTLMAAGVRSGTIHTVAAEHSATGLAEPCADCSGEVYVYRRQGRRCRVCSATIRTDRLAGRNIFWCPRCQPVFRSRARSAS